MQYNTLNINGKGLETLSKIKLKNAKLKIKVSRAMRWFKDEVTDLQAGIETVNEKYDLVSQYTKDGDWKGTEEEKQTFLSDSKDKAKELASVMKEDISVELEPIFDLNELSEIKELDADSISDLMILGLIIDEE